MTPLSSPVRFRPPAIDATGLVRPVDFPPLALRRSDTPQQLPGFSASPTTPTDSNCPDATGRPASKIAHPAPLLPTKQSP
jgi:hypothetical protein